MNIANKVSIFRILTVPFFITCLVYYTPEKDFLRLIALAIFLLAVLSDAIDGFVARQTKQKSRAGLVLDPLADKLLLISAFICLYLIDLKIKFPLWVTLIVLSRDAIILLGAVVIYMVRQNIDIRSTAGGKLTTISQMFSVISVLMQWRFSYVLWLIAIFLTVLSGMDYIRRGFKILYAVDNNLNNH